MIHYFPAIFTVLVVIAFIAGMGAGVHQVIQQRKEAERARRKAEEEE